MFYFKLRIKLNHLKDFILDFIVFIKADTFLRLQLLYQ